MTIGFAFVNRILNRKEIQVAIFAQIANSFLINSCAKTFLAFVCNYRSAQLGKWKLRDKIFP